MDASALSDAQRSELGKVLDPLRELLTDFVERHIDPADFEVDFFNRFADIDDSSVSADVGKVLDWYFFSVEDHVADPALRDEPEDLDSDELRARTIELLAAAGSPAHRPEQRAKTAGG